jgi:hypothetical protein
MVRYEYDKLDSSSNHIRLVKLYPARSSKLDLKCEMFHVPLERDVEIPTTRPSQERLREVIPTDWEVLETLEGRYLFAQAEGDKCRYSWSHPHPRFANVDLRPPPSTSAVIKYEALSYTWGAAGGYNSLTVSRTSDLWGWVDRKKGKDGSDKRIQQYLPIGRNLASALRRLRLRDEPRILWIYAVCINQCDVVERNEQVRCMRDIYE